MRPKYREIIRLAQPRLKLSQEKIAASCNASKGTVNKVLKAARDMSFHGHCRDPLQIR